MKILAIETSTLTGSVALVSDGTLLGETTLSVSVQHSERLLPTIEQLLRDASVASADVDLYAVAEGPGSFTGLRIGIAAAQGLAMAHGKPLVGVSTLQGLAMNAVFFPGIVVPVLNAFRGEVYFGLYRTENGRPEPLEDDAVLSMDAFVEKMSSLKQKGVVVGNGADLCKDRLAALGEDRILINSSNLNVPRASNLAFLAEHRTSTTPVLPRYLRKPG